ncbi:family 43 glycosylhydrolase [Paenibacillus sonchi]|uniref:family 43 glycosylhydrolase n=1 Tax=Paenibacillus sonchi TaxID=373687 RepID=UPI0002D84C4A|nr:family 43 glycosylhydrolase [Paenibacillus sonchi]
MRPIRITRTTAHDLTFAFQQAGHGSMVETQSGEWYMAHLCTRPIPGTGTMNPLGRETAIQHVVWTDDGWLRLAHGGKLPALAVEGPDLEPHPFPELPERDDYDTLGYPYQSLRVPFDPSLSRKQRIACQAAGLRFGVLLFFFEI